VSRTVTVYASPYGSVDFTENLSELLERALKVIPEKAFMRSIGPDIFASIRQNFDAGGRPIKWDPSQRVSGIKWNKKQGMKRPQTLILTSWLKDSITPDTRYKEDLVFRVDADYGIFHQQPPGWGSRRNVPARPFLVIQDEDREKAAEKAQAWLDQLLS
jgi:phage gpG-like protein